MAETAYERFLKDPDKEEAVNIDIKEQPPLDIDQVKLKIQNELSSQSAPKKPVKWLAMPDPKSVLEMYYTFNPTQRLGNAIAGIKDPMQQVKDLPDAKAPRFRINNEEVTQERDYTTGLDEITKGINSGIYDMQNSIGSLLFAGTDLKNNTDFLSDFEKIMEKNEPTRS